MEAYNVVIIGANAGQALARQLAPPASASYCVCGD